MEKTTNKCEYEKDCIIVSNDFCCTDERFNCKIYRRIEEKRMKYEDEL